jgi:hypothetical protein
LPVLPFPSSDVLSVIGAILAHAAAALVLFLSYSPLSLPSLSFLDATHLFIADYLFFCSPLCRNASFYTLS